MKSWLKTVVTLAALLAVLSPGAAMALRGVTCEKYITHLSTGDQTWTDRLEVENTASTAREFVLTLYGNGIEVYSATLSVASLSKEVYNLKALAPAATCGKVEYCGTDLGFMVTYENVNGGVAAFNLADNIPGNNISFLFSNFAAFVEWKGLALMNTGAASQSVQLMAYGGDQLLGTAQVTVDAHDRVVDQVANFFTGLTMAQIERVEANGTNICGLTVSGAILAPRFLFVPAVATLASGCDRYLSHVTGNDDNWTDVLEVDNSSPDAKQYTLTLYEQGDVVYTGAITVPGYAYRAVNLKGLAAGATCGLVTACDPQLKFRISYEHTSGSVAGFAVNGAALSQQLVFLFEEGLTSPVWKGIAFMNAGGDSQDVTLYAVGGGSVLASRQESVDPMSRLVGQYYDFFPLLPVDQVDAVVAVAGSAVMRGLSITGSLANLGLVFSLANETSGFSGGEVVTSDLVVFAWNDLGMHCLNPTYDEAVILPPYNTIWAQVVERGNPPRIVTQNLTVEYRIIDNTFSSGKRDYGQFWEYDQLLFGVDLAVDTGLNLVEPAIHNGLSGTMRPHDGAFIVDGIPLTPVDDNGLWNPYQVAEVTVKNLAGQTLATTRATAPTSDEINCSKCHGADAFTNILNTHPLVDGQSLASRAPVLCASCHGSPALGSAPGDRGSAGLYLSEAIHGKHSTTSALCYDCHPGNTTKCSRSLRHTSDNGNCVTCHGTLGEMASQIALGTKIPWVNEPKCSNCHGGVPGVDTGAFLYRNSTGHGNLNCPACHQSPHAMVPSREASDNYQATQYMGAAVSMGSCAACHNTSKGPSDEGLGEFAEEHAGPNPERQTACHVCHTQVSMDTANWPHSFGWQAR